MLNRLAWLYVILLLVGLEVNVNAAEVAAQSFTLDGRLYSDSIAKSPLKDQLTLKVQILNLAQDCILYEETQLVDTRNTNGYYNVQIGESVGAITGKRSSGDSANTYSSVFSNILSSVNGKILVDGSTACVYSPIAGTTSLTVHRPTDHGATTASKHTVYNFIVMGTHVYVAWVPRL